MENSVRLVGELAKNEGFVAICLGGRWGKVCGGWVAEARVVCRQLGFSTDSEYLETKIKCVLNCFNNIHLYYDRRSWTVLL